MYEYIQEVVRRLTDNGSEEAVLSKNPSKWKLI